MQHSYVADLEFIVERLMKPLEAVGVSVIRLCLSVGQTSLNLDLMTQKSSAWQNPLTRATQEAGKIVPGPLVRSMFGQ